MLDELKQETEETKKQVEETNSSEEVVIGKKIGVKKSKVILDD